MTTDPEALRTYRRALREIARALAEQRRIAEATA